MPPQLRLATGEIHLWLSFFCEMADEQLYACRELLATEERDQERRFYFARDKRRYLVTRAMVRTVLSRYTQIDPRAWIFSKNAYGRPEIANAELRDEILSFNLSHTNSVIVLGVTRRGALGVDVENFWERHVSVQLANHFFSPEEVEALCLMPRHQQQCRFFEYWTFKEAYIKARGMGLSLPFDKFSFRYPHDAAVEMAVHPGLQDDPSRWQFWQFRPSPQYLVAICAERIDTRPSSVAIRKVVPTANEEMLTLLSSRSSK